ncbi:MAG: FBP domain-containing protein [Microbacteriaceae bacterium]
MKPLTATDIRDSIVNASAGEIARMPLPGLHEMLWEDREYLGWRNAKSPLRAYLVHWLNDRPIGVMLRASEIPLTRGISAMCTLCHTSQPSYQVTLFTALRAGSAGRNGNTVGTYMCDDLSCSHIIRILPPAHPLSPDPAEVVAERAAGLIVRVTSFTSDVARTAEESR